MVLAATESHDRKRESERAVSPTAQVSGSSTRHLTTPLADHVQVTGSGMSESELKQALLALVRSKHEMEELNTRLEDDLVQQRKHCEVSEGGTLGRAGGTLGRVGGRDIREER